MASGYLNHVRDIETLRKLLREYEQESARKKRSEDTVRRFPGSYSPGPVRCPASAAGRRTNTLN